MIMPPAFKILTIGMSSPDAFLSGVPNVLCASTLDAAFEILGAGHGVSLAGAGRDAFNAILLDATPGGALGADGAVHACASIRAKVGLADMAILLLVEDASPGLLSRAMVAGASDFIRVPFGRAELSARLRAITHVRALLGRLHRTEAELAHRHDVDQHVLAAKSLEPRSGLFTQQFQMAVLTSKPETHMNGADFPSEALVARIDQLGAFIEAHGDMAGWEMIRRAGQAIGNAMAPLASLLAVDGQGDFFLLTPALGHGGITILAESIRREAARAQIRHGHSSLSGHVTLSVGGAIWQKGDPPWLSRLVAEAVLALEEAIDAGGDRVCIRKARPKDG